MDARKRTAVVGLVLATTLGGPALILDSTHRPGEHHIGRIEVDLVAPAVASQQALFAYLTTPCASDCGRLLAPSGQPLSTIAPPAKAMVRGRSTISSSGGPTIDTRAWSDAAPDD